MKKITNDAFKNTSGVAEVALPLNSSEQKLGKRHVLFSEVFVVEIHHATSLLTSDGDGSAGRMGEMETVRLMKNAIRVLRRKRKKPCSYAVT